MTVRSHSCRFVLNWDLSYDVVSNGEFGLLTNHLSDNTDLDIYLHKTITRLVTHTRWMSVWIQWHRLFKTIMYWCHKATYFLELSGATFIMMQSMSLNAHVSTSYLSLGKVSGLIYLSFIGLSSVTLINSVFFQLIKYNSIIWCITLHVDDEQKSVIISVPNPLLIIYRHDRAAVQTYW